MLEVKLSGSAISFKYPVDKAGTLESFTTTANALATLATAMNRGFTPGFTTYIGHIKYNVTGAAAGKYNILDLDGNPIVLPPKSRVWDGYYEVITTFTSSTDAATISFDINTDDVAGLKAATAISTGTTYDATGAAVQIIPDGTITNISEKTTAARNLQYTVATETLTAGELILFIEVVTAL